MATIFQGKSIRLITVSLSLITFVPAQAQTCATGTPASTPSWVDAISNGDDAVGSPGQSYLFESGNAAPRTTGVSLPFTTSQPSSNVGELDTLTYPSGPPWASNAATPVSCSIGTTCDGSVQACSSGIDCTGQNIPRGPGSAVVTPQMTGVKGFSYLGTFNETVTGSSGLMYNSVYFHQNIDYLGGIEFGIYRQSSAPDLLIFYWSMNTNCGVGSSPGGVTVTGPTLCTTSQVTGGTRNSATYLYTDSPITGTPANQTNPQSGNYAIGTPGCYVALGTGSGGPGWGKYYYSMWAFYDSGSSSYKFAMSILDPTTFANKVPTMVIDPNAGSTFGGSPSPWYPISTIGSGTPGYVTAGISLTDPSGSGTGTYSGNMYVERIAVGN